VLEVVAPAVQAELVPVVVVPAAEGEVVLAVAVVRAALLLLQVRRSSVRKVIFGSGNRSIRALIGSACRVW
jgi:hypothetical protein